MNLETIASGIEVIKSEAGDVYVNLNGTILNLNTTDFEGTTQNVAEAHADAKQCSYGQDPLYYVNQYCMKG